LRRRCTECHCGHQQEQDRKQRTTNRPHGVSPDRLEGLDARGAGRPDAAEARYAREIQGA
jgi:hypothetical protein